MINAKKELLDKLQSIKYPTNSIKCAIVDSNCKTFLLPVNYTEDQFEDFISNIDFDYDNGWGGQELYGEVWFNDGTWLERGEYDGSEWWSFKKCPEIPSKLFTNNG